MIENVKSLGQIIGDAVDVHTDQPIFTARIPNPATTIRQRIVKLLGRHQEELVFEVKRTRVASIERIAAITMRMPADALASLQQANTELSASDFLPLFANHANDLIEIIAIALINRDEEPSKQLKHLIRREFDTALMLHVLQMVYHQLNMQDFLSSIVLAKGLNVLPKTSREQTGGIIAPGE